MASNYFPVSLLEQPWDDDQLGTLSSLERRQRKAAEKQDVNAFYKFLGVVFVTLNLALLGSELYTFATEPSRGLTGAFLLEIGRMSGVACGQLQNLYKALGDVVWTGVAWRFGHDFAQRGVSIADGAAQLLASGLYYLALALSVLVMYNAFPGVARSPLRTMTLSTAAACALFGSPPLYAWLVSRLCHTRTPEPVVLWALLFSAIMCWGSVSAARAISGRGHGEGLHSQSSSARHRSAAGAPRRQPAAGAAGAAGGAFGGGGGPSGGVAGPGGGCATVAASGLKRTYSRASSSSGRSGAGGGGSADPTLPPVARSGSSTSLSGGPGLLAGFTCWSGQAGSAAPDPVGIHASARGLHGVGSCGSCGSCSVDFTSAAAAAVACPPQQQQKHAGTAVGNGRGVGPVVHSSGSTSRTVDPVASVPLSSRGGSSAASRHGGGGLAGSSASGSSNAAAAAAAKSGTSSMATGKQRQQQKQGGGGGGLGGAGSGADGALGSAGSRAKQQQQQQQAAATATNQTRGSAAQPSSNPSRGTGGGSSSKAAVGAHSFNAKQHQQHHQPPASNSVAVPLEAAAATCGSAFLAPPAAAQKKASGNANAAAAAAAAAPSLVTGLSASSAAQASSGPAAGPSVAGKSVSGSKASAGGSTAASSVAAAATSKGAVQVNGGSSVGPGTEGATVTAAVATASGAASLLSRLAGSVATAATSAAATPAMAGKGFAKKGSPAAAAASTARKPQVHQPQPQYIIVPPPPPPPRKPQVTALADSAAASAGAAAGANPVRNAWLNPNPVIKIAAGVAKGPKGTRPPAAAPPQAAAATAVPSARSGGGAAASSFGASPPTSLYARSASYGGAGNSTSGVTSADPPLFGGYGARVNSPHSAYARVPLFADATATVAAGGSPHGVGAAVGEPVTAAATAAAAATESPALDTLASAFLPPLAQEHLRNQVQQYGSAAVEGLISTTFVSSDAAIGPIVAHKHASGDLDIASVAANYRPYPSSAPSTAAQAFADAVPIVEVESADSFSLFSTPPPPLITAESATAGAELAGAGLAAADAEVGADGAPRLAQMLYGTYGTYSLGGDPVWSHNVPSVFTPAAALGGSCAPRVPPPPGFPSHAYGGAFAVGPVPGAAASDGGSGWEHPPASATATAATVSSPNGHHHHDAVPPLPPAVENGVLASLGFVDDGGADSGSAGGGDDAGASCAICWSAPRQVGFLHGKTSHLCVCRRCAAKLREGVHRCPMCRQLIERIIDIY